MFENLDELRNYIYVNFTPMDRERAINFYSEKAGVSLEEATLEVDKIYAKRQQNGMVLPTPKQWTPIGQKYETGKRMYEFSIFAIILNTIISIPCTVIILSQGPLMINEFFTVLFLSSIFVPISIIFAILAWMGKKKMKKYEKQYSQLTNRNSAADESHSHTPLI